MLLKKVLLWMVTPSLLFLCVTVLGDNYGVTIMTVVFSTGKIKLKFNKAK